MGLTWRRTVRDQTRAASLAPTEVKVDVDRLVLEGFDGLDAASVGEALQEDLARLIVQGLPGAWRSPSSVGTVTSYPMAIPSGVSSHAVGSLIATAVRDTIDGAAEDR